MTAEGADPHFVKLDQNTEYLEALICTSFKKLKVSLTNWSAKSAPVPFSSPLVERFLLSQGQVQRMNAPIPYLSKPKWIWRMISNHKAWSNTSGETWSQCILWENWQEEGTLWRVLLAIFVSKCNNKNCFLVLENISVKMLHISSWLTQWFCFVGVEQEGTFFS